VRFLGLDLSLTSTGYSHADNCGVISVNSNKAKRLIEISESIGNLIVEFKIDAVSIEGYAFSSRKSQAHSIGELGGVVRVMLHRMDIPYIEIPPTCRAKFATGRGNASKNEVISFVSAKTGLIWKNPGADDKCDAWILEEMALAQIGKQRFDWPKTSLEVLNKVDWSPLESIEKDEK
jgi:Holliday junction resolvasome RuvABC endonuclease subunit